MFRDANIEISDRIIISNPVSVILFLISSDRTNQFLINVFILFCLSGCSYFPDFIITTHFEYIVACKHERPDPMDKTRFEMKKLIPEDLPEVLMLQERVHSTMADPSCFVMTSEEEFSESLEKDLCLGIYHNGVLAAASLLIYNRDTDRNLGKKMGFDPLECATLDTAFVDERFRGAGLQRELISCRLREAYLNGAKYSFATVAPENTHSLNNLTDSGFEIYKKTHMYGNYLRYVLIRTATGGDLNAVNT